MRATGYRVLSSRPQGEISAASRDVSPRIRSGVDRTGVKLRRPRSRAWPAPTGPQSRRSLSIADFSPAKGLSLRMFQG